MRRNAGSQLEKPNSIREDLLYARNSWRSCPFAILIGASDRAQKLHFTGANSLPNGLDSVASSPQTTELSHGAFLVVYVIPSVHRVPSCSLSSSLPLLNVFRCPFPFSSSSPLVSLALLHLGSSSAFSNSSILSRPLSLWFLGCIPPARSRRHASHPSVYP